MQKIFFVKSLLLIVLLFTINEIFGQTISVSGVITSSEDNLSIPGVNVIVKGTKKGTNTDIDGKYILTNVSLKDTLVFSLISYKSQIIPINNRNNINIKLKPDVQLINEVVVTALGVKREKKSLGYSIQEVKGDELQTAKELSVINSLSGKVAGLNVSSTNGGAGSSSRIVLRGNNSFNDNQALIVVDGVPINNSTTSSSENTWGGTDYGNGVSDINPDDIESISVLKGASASALYGSRAANGVILITTKKGKASKNIAIVFNTSTSIDMPYILSDFQNTYGAGRNGKFEGCWRLNSDNIYEYDATSSSAFGSWGPKMEDQKIIDWDGKESTFSPQPKNYRDFVRNGITSNNSFSIEGGKEKITFRFTFADLRNNDIVPGTSVSRTNVGLNSTVKLSDKIKLNGFVSYVRQKAKNRLGLSDSHTNVSRNYIMMPRNISDQSLEDNLMDSNGKEQTWYMNWQWQTNPYWNKEFELNQDIKDRTFGNIFLNYQLSKNISLLLRTAPDYSVHNFWNRQALNGLISSLGSYSESKKKQLQINSDALLSYQKEINKNYTLTANIGGNAMYQKSEIFDANTNGGISEPFVYSLENSKQPISQRNTLYKKAINSVYGSAQIDMKHYLFLEVTGRNDWSSTLPKANNSYFYPSVNIGFVYSDLFNLDKLTKGKITYGKIRLSRAGVGNDTDPYQLEPTYILDTNNTEGYGTWAYIVNVVPSKSLLPEKLISNEIGSDIRLFSNRIGIDLTYYKTNSFNQIIRAPVSSTSGYSAALINAGNIQNKGIEIQLKADIIKKDKFTWNSILNYTKNNSLVVKLTNGVEKYVLLEHWGLSIEARPGNPYGDIVGNAILRDNNGNKLLNENGMYIKDSVPKILGNINPDFKLSLLNNFTIKNITFSFLVDAQIGGEMFAGSNMYGYGYSGNFKETLEGREEWYTSEKAREEAGISPNNWTPTGGYLAEGVYQAGTIINGVDVSGQTNSTYVNPQLYWDQFSSWTNEIHEPFVYDASYVKLRELTISYKLPEKWFNKIKIKEFTVAVYGRNLWLIYSKVPNIDPESFFTNGNGQGYELYSYPGRRSIGININIKF